MNRAMVSVLGALGLLAAGSCMTDACGCTPTSISAVVNGRVVDGAGAPVRSARVQAYSAPADGCYSLDSYLGATFAESDGRYSLGIRSGAVGDSVCVLVFADSPFGAAALGASDTSLLVMDFDEFEPGEAQAQLVLVPR